MQRGGGKVFIASHVSGSKLLRSCGGAHTLKTEPALTGRGNLRSKENLSEREPDRTMGIRGKLLAEDIKGEGPRKSGGGDHRERGGVFGAIDAGKGTSEGDFR